MKKITTIIFIILASIFCFKSIIAYLTSTPYTISYMIDIEEESSEEEDADEKKSDSEEWFFGLTENTHAVNFNFNNSFRYNKDKGYHTPYFEIHSPPPNITL